MKGLQYLTWLFNMCFDTLICCNDNTSWIGFINQTNFQIVKENGGKSSDSNVTEYNRIIKVLEWDKLTKQNDTCKSFDVLQTKIMCRLMIMLTLLSRLQLLIYDVMDCRTRFRRVSNRRPRSISFVSTCCNFISNNIKHLHYLALEIWA